MRTTTIAPDFFVLTDPIRMITTMTDTQTEPSLQESTDLPNDISTGNESVVVQLPSTSTTNRTLIYDLEVYPNFFLALFYDIVNKTYHTYSASDQLLQDIILNNNVTLIGYNNHYYDDIILRFIASKAQQKDESKGTLFANDLPFVTTLDIYKLSCRIINRNLLHTDQAFKYPPRNNTTEFKSIDVKSVLDPMPSLKKVEMRTRFHNVQDLPIDPHANVTDEQQTLLTQYCQNDVDATYHLYEHYAKDHITLRDFLADKFGLFDPQRVKSMSEPRVAEYILTSQFRRLTNNTMEQLHKKKSTLKKIPVDQCLPDWVRFSTPEMQQLLESLKFVELRVNPLTGYAIGDPLKRIVTLGDRDYQMGIGGLHSVDKAGVFDASDGALIDADVTSYYPSMVISDNQYPVAFSTQWTDIYKGIYTERIAAKADPDKQLEAQALKIVLNATFGKFGSMYSPMYDPTLLIRITLGGQLGLLMLIEECVLNDITVLSANTDGILVRCESSLQRDTFGGICDQWQHNTGLNLEYTQYRRVARRDVNNYTALTLDNKVKNKGVFTPPGLKHDVQAAVIQSMAREYLLYGQTPEEYLSDNADSLTIYDFLFSFSATSAFEIRLEKNNDKENFDKLTKSNRWYITNSSDEPLRIVKFGGKNQNRVSIPNGKNIRLANTITSTQVPMDVDFDYYIAQAEKLIRSCQ